MSEENKCNECGGINQTNNYHCSGECDRTWCATCADHIVFHTAKNGDGIICENCATTGNIVE